MLDDVGVTRFKSGKNLKELILADMAKKVGSDLISVGCYKLYGGDINAFKYGTGVNPNATPHQSKKQ